MGIGYLESIRVITKLCTVAIVTMHMIVSIRVFTESTRVLSGNTMKMVGKPPAWWCTVGLPRLRSA